MADFIESPRFPGCFALNFTSDPEYRVVITRRSSGVELRRRAWSRPLVRITGSVGPRHETEIQEILAWWHMCGGTATGFRVKDATDFKSCNVSDTPLATDQPLVLTDTPGVYQLTKRYQAGVDEDNNPVYQDYDVFKPVQGTVLLSGAGSVDYTTGLVSGSSGGTWGGEFDRPMRFDSGFPVAILNQRIMGVDFALVEIRLGGAVGEESG